MIVIDNITTEEINDRTKLTIDIIIDGKVKKLWYTVNKNFGKYFLTKRCDGILVATLIYALENGQDIKCNIPVSEKLYFQLTKNLIPFLCNSDKSLKNISIDCKLDNTNYNIEGKVGTGISCGVDSLSTILDYSNVNNDNKINMLTLYNSGYYGESEQSSLVYSKYIGQSEKFALEHNYDFLEVDSNLSSIYKYNFSRVHTYLTCSITLMFQELFKVYYYSSGYSIFDFKYNKEESSSYDIFLLDCISTEGLKFYSAQSTITRIEKVRNIAKNKEFLKHLYVCFYGNPPYNCTKCEKCIRTVLEADALGMLDNFKDVFDLNLYKKYRLLYIAYAIRQKRRNVFYKEIYKYLKKNDAKSLRLAYLLYLIPSPLDLRQNKIVIKIVTTLRKKKGDKVAR